MVKIPIQVYLIAGWTISYEQACRIVTNMGVEVTSHRPVACDIEDWLLEQGLDYEVAECRLNPEDRVRDDSKQFILVRLGHKMTSEYPTFTSEGADVAIPAYDTQESDSVRQLLAAALDVNEDMIFWLVTQHPSQREEWEKRFMMKDYPNDVMGDLADAPTESVLYTISEGDSSSVAVAEETEADSPATGTVRECVQRVVLPVRRRYGVG